MRDMVGAMAILLICVGVLVAFTRGCSFAPGGPVVDPTSAPTVDMSKRLDDAAASVPFPVRRPELPVEWRANSASTEAVSAVDVVFRIGWLTPDGNFVQLSQSGGEVADVLAAETGQEQPVARGEIDVAGVRWDSYPARRDEPAWVTELDGTVLLITGSASEDDFRRLAAAVQEAEPLPGA
jgi:hypothetical protein